MARKVLVTGGAGFIGSHLVEQLLADGHSVRVLDNLSVGRRENVPARAELLIGDVREPADVKRAVADVDSVCHLAARVSIRASVSGFREDADANVMGTLTLLQGCGAGGVKRFVYASSMGVYADAPTPDPISETHRAEPISPYGVSKLAGEQYLRCLAGPLGLEPVALRLFNTFGPRQAHTPYVGVITIFARRLLSGKPPVIFGDGEQTRDFVHVSDAASAFRLALVCDVAGETFNVGTGIGRTVNQIAAMLCRRIRPDIAPLYAPAHPGELRFSVPDITRARQRLGFSPRYRFEETIDDIIGWYRN